MNNAPLPPLRHATETDIPALLRLADECVGPGLYVEADLRAMFAREVHVMLVQDAPDGDIWGYYFGYLLPAWEASAQMKFSPGQTAATFPDLQETVAMCKSIGVSQRARGCHLGRLLQSTATNELIAAGGTTQYALTWRNQGVVHMDHLLRQLGFTYLFDTQKVWYDIEGLTCPACGQPHCVCPAAIYRKKGA